MFEITECHLYELTGTADSYLREGESLRMFTVALQAALVNLRGSACTGR